MSNDYVIEKLTNAMDVLAMGRGDVRSRLRDAYLCMHTLKETDFPNDLKKDWTWIIEKLTQRGPLVGPDDKIILGSVGNTMRSIRNKTGQKIAQRISNLYWEISNNKKYS